MYLLVHKKIKSSNDAMSLDYKQDFKPQYLGNYYRYGKSENDIQKIIKFRNIVAVRFDLRSMV